MKYIVVVGSHTQFLSSIGSLKTINIDDPQDVLVLYIRNYQNLLFNIPYKELCIYDLYEMSLDSIRNKHNRKKIISSLDLIISNFVRNDVFYAFLPHVAVPIFQIIATNSSCIGLKFVQEGATPFKRRFEKTLDRDYFVFSFYNYFFLSDHRCWKTHKWLLPNFLKKRVTVETYDLFDFFKYMPEVDKHYVIQWPHIDIDYELDSQKPCFIFDSFVEMKCVSFQTYSECVMSLVSKYGSSFNYIKFHPAQSESHKNSIKEIFVKQKMSYEELPMYIPFECFIIKYDQLKVIGFYSSLLELAKQINQHEVILETELLINSSGSFKKWYSVNV